MIEYRHKKTDRKPSTSWTYAWKDLTGKNITIFKNDFTNYEIRIFGKTFTEDSPKFRKYLTNARLWRILSD